MPTYDHAFYKQLSKNDLGQSNNQAGPAIPVALRRFFPPLPVNASGPTEEYYITLEVFDGAMPIGVVTSRWQSQTWRRRRSREFRLTRGIGPALLSRAAEGDILVFEREATMHDRYRATLVRKGTAEHRSILRANSNNRWGPVDPNHVPLSLTGITTELTDIEKQSQAPFQLFQSGRAMTPTRRLLRDAAFGRLVSRAYDHRCVACGEGWLEPVDNSDHDPPAEPEAAHIVPVALGGVDDLRNGIALCRSHHWAFDHGLLYVDEHSLWRVTNSSKRENRNQSLNDIDGAKLRPPVAGPSPEPAALAWHRAHVQAS